MQPKSVRRAIAVAAIIAGVGSVTSVAAQSSTPYMVAKEYCKGGTTANNYQSLDTAVTTYVLAIEHRDIAHYQYRFAMLKHGSHTVHERTWKCS